MHVNRYLVVVRFQHRQMPPLIATNTRMPDVNPCHHRHLNLIVASTPSCSLVFVVLPLYTRHREGQLPERQKDSGAESLESINYLSAGWGPGTELIIHQMGPNWEF